MIIVRRERLDDVESIDRVTDAAFRKPTNDPPVEPPLVHALRADAGWVPELSLVAIGDDEQLVGHVVCTRGACGGAPALGLGPISVDPDLQGRGIGSALMYAVLGAAQALDERLVVLLGDPEYYRRFGFVSAEDLHVESPDAAWGHYFQARALLDGHPQGCFRYAAPFSAL